MRVALNLLNDSPYEPTGAVQFWTHLIPEMDRRLRQGEELALMVSPANRHLYQGYGPQTRFVTFPWSNERRILRTLTEQFWAPIRLPLSGVDLLDTVIAPVINPWTLVLHVKTMHAFATPEQLPFLSRHFRRMSYPRSARRAAVIIVNSESLRDEITGYLPVDPARLHLVYEAVDHELFTPRSEAGEHDEALARFGVRRPFVLFLSSLWRYKNADGLLRAWAAMRDDSGNRQLVVVGFPRDEGYVAEIKQLARDLGIAGDVVFCGGVDHEDTAMFYRAADLFVYPSFNETFGLTLLEAMACGCPVVTSNISAMPEIAGGAALLADPRSCDDIASKMLAALEPETRTRLVERGFARAAEFSWARAADETLAVYREVMEGRR